MKLGLGVLRLSPRTFWNLTLPEWRACIAGRLPARTAPMKRDDLEHLMQRYPDGTP